MTSQHSNKCGLTKRVPIHIFFAGAYQHIDFVRDDRARTHKILRIKAPKGPGCRQQTGSNMRKPLTAASSKSAVGTTTTTGVARQVSPITTPSSLGDKSSLDSVDVKKSNKQRPKKSQKKQAFSRVDQCGINDVCSLPALHSDSQWELPQAEDPQMVCDPVSLPVVPSTSSDDVMPLFDHDIDGASLTMDDLQDLWIESDMPNAVPSSDVAPDTACSSSYPQTIQFPSCGAASIVSEDDDEFESHSNANLMSLDDFPDDFNLFYNDVTDDIISLLGTGQ